MSTGNEAMSIYYMASNDYLIWTEAGNNSENKISKYYHIQNNIIMPNMAYPSTETNEVYHTKQKERSFKGKSPTTIHHFTFSIVIVQTIYTLSVIIIISLMATGSCTQYNGAPQLQAYTKYYNIKIQPKTSAGSLRFGKGVHQSLGTFQT